MTDVTRIDSRDLPQLSGASAAGLTRAARAVAALPAHVEVPVGELGLVRIACAGVRAHAHSGPDEGESPSDVALGLTRASGTGRLVVDGVLARRIVAASVGMVVRPDAPLVRLGLAERGVVAGVAAGVITALGGPFSVSLVAPSAGAGGVAVALSIEAADWAGWVRLEVPVDWLPEPARAPELGRMDIEARIELASTRLTAREVAGVEVGDAIVFDGEPAVSGALNGREVRIRVGPLFGRGELRENGAVLLLEALRSAVVTARAARSDAHHMREEASLETRDEAEHPTEREARTQPADVAALLADMPVEIVAEVGRVSLRGDEVAALAPGSVLRLGRVVGAPVALRVGEQLWAEGELVSVDGELGVRVTATRGRGLP
jgi:type III secretion system YscQ/HrcQ family protein